MMHYPISLVSKALGNGPVSALKNKARMMKIMNSLNSEVLLLTVRYYFAHCSFSKTIYLNVHMTISKTNKNHCPYLESKAVMKLDVTAEDS